jgi:MYXO-CTERM domain-containing protein
MKRFGLSLVFSSMTAASTAIAHPGGGPAVAWPNEPEEVGVVADQSFEFSWYDSNFIPLPDTGTITIDWYYTARMPPSFQLGTTPPELEGTPIVLGVPEYDRTDRFVWDTSTVAPGSYVIWSRVNDLPDQTNSLKIIAFSRGVVTIAHAGDPVYPAIAVVTPQSPFVITDRSFDVKYEAFDPDGTARVKIEAMTQRDGSDAIVIAENIAVGTATIGSVTWDTSNLPNGDWIVRGTIADDRGLSFTAYARFLLRVEHLDPYDAGVRPDAAPGRDAGLSDAGEKKEDDGCGCRSTASSSSSSALVILLGAMGWMRRRRFR